MTICAFSVRNLILQVALSCLILAFSLIISRILFSLDYATITVAPLIAGISAWILSYTYLLSTEEREKNKIRKMFSQYVSPAALNVMVDHYDEYTAAGMGTKETVTVLFSDVRGFTTLSEQLKAEQVVEILNHYFTQMTVAIHQHKGTIDKFIGDAIMAIWGAPIKSSTHALDAVQASIEMMEKLTQFNIWLTEKEYAPINIGVGINTGDVVLGSIGSEQKADYTVIGDNVNLTSRLESLTKFYGCNILISQTTQEAIKSHLQCQLVDIVKVKGKQQAIKIYTPLYQQPLADANQFVEQSEIAFQHYLNRDWQRAITAFSRLPVDNIQKLLVQRCKAYQTTPPSDDWDGSVKLSHK